MPTTPQPSIPWLDLIVSGLAQANVAIPIIFTTVSGMIALWRSATGGTDLTPTQLADLIEAKTAANAAYGANEIARLRALIAAGEPQAPQA